MAVPPRQLLSLDYVWRGYPKVSVAATGLDTLSMDYVWRGAPLPADAVQPDPVLAWGAASLSLDAAAASGVVQAWWGAPDAGVDAGGGAPVSAAADGSVSPVLEFSAPADLTVAAPDVALEVAAEATAAATYTVSVAMHSDVYVTTYGTMAEANVTHADTYLSVSATIYGTSSWVVVTGWARAGVEFEVRGALELVASCLVARYIPLDLSASYYETQAFSVRVVEGCELAASGIDAFHYDAILVTEDGARAVLVKCR